MAADKPFAQKPSEGSDPLNSSLLPTYARADLAFDRGEGAWLISTKGERFLDFGSGIAVNGLGHAHPHLVEALLSQGRKLWHTSNLYQIPEAEKLAARLVEATFADLVFFTNSGTETLDGAVKTARKYQYVSGHPEKNRIITIEGAFHGRTLAAIAAGGNPKYLEGFEPRLEGFDCVAFNDLDALKAAIGPATGAILLEPIQGEGGVRVLPQSYLEAVRRLCDENGLLLIYDEVQTGVGRTGPLFAYQRVGVAPDIMMIAKGIGGGFPIGAFLATRAAGAGMTLGSHGSTYGGNPLGTAIGNAVLDIVLADGFLARSAHMGALLKDGLQKLQGRYPDVVAEIRGEGLLLGIKTHVPVAEFVAAAIKEKIIVIPASDNVARILPPLIVSESEVAEGLHRLEAALGRFAGSAPMEKRVGGAAG